MGNTYAHYVSHPDTTPGIDAVPSFDPQVGFPTGRKPRVMIATEAEMRSARLPIENRDYCAHILLNYHGCRARVWPWAYQCAHEKHEYLTCQYEDFILRMKEYERERRLLARQQRKQQTELTA